MKKLRVLLVGSSGRMGREILALLEIEKTVSIVEGVSKDADKNNGAKTKRNISEVDATKVDAVIDFSSPELSLEVVRWCLKNKKPLVCGTTGFSESEFKVFAESSKKLPILYASNMSLGVAVLKKAMSAFSAISDYDFQIVESHHNKKKDKPSGTAKMLQGKLDKTTRKKNPQVLSIRGGGIFGVHEIHAMGEEETLKFSHTALNRVVFARGAIRAVQFLAKQSPGLYSIDDILAEDNLSGELLEQKK